eukprot:CAMPEP_0196810328 /NCGR_PEP_ID=MMETSP1362-20130617/10144_1 /TAXON_ID=163516 /ORGANISM="Leptocylindrus danicus, Strain CCMP1856" /LENGTH=220 /DNA_ID=CAMNT_0042185265 /DNA_START=203 /DNA_END=862 /DNA_ORIENTATION=-
MSQTTTSSSDRYGVLVGNNNMPSSRYFSDASSVRDDLSAILAREIDEEEANFNVEMPEELAEIKADIERNWRVVESTEPGNMVVKLFRKEAGIGGAKVMIQFNCQDREDEELDEGQGMDELASGVRFEAVLTKAGRGLVFSCFTIDAEVHVESVSLRAADEIDAEDDGTFYRGPEMHELEGDLQQALGDFIREEYDLDADFAAFLSMYADYKEQMEYMNW